MLKIHFDYFNCGKATTQKGCILFILNKLFLNFELKIQLNFKLKLNRNYHYFY